MRLQIKLIVVALLATIGCAEGGSDRERGPRGSAGGAGGTPGAYPNERTEGRATTPILGSGFQLFPNDPGRSQRFANRFPVFSNSQVAFLRPGADFYNIRMKMLNSAQRSVRIQYLLFHGDESGWRIAQKLVQLKNRGLDVKIIIDDLSNYSLKDQHLYFYLRNNGIVIEGWEFLFLNLIGSASKRDAFGIIADNANRRYHEKMFIVDGEDPQSGRAIIGGANIGNNYFRVENETAERMWMDSEVIVKGDVVGKIAQIYDENIAHFRQKRVFKGSSELLWSAVNAVFTLSNTPESLNETFLSRLDQIAAAPLNLTWSHVPMRFIQSRPREQEDYIYPVFLELINNAKKEILISNAYFVPDEGFIAALRNAAKRGVVVHILTNTKETIDFPHVVVVGRTSYKDILSVNNEIGQQRVFIHEWGGDIHLGNGEGQNHSKFIVVDEQQVLLGSYNIDPRSRWLNSESVLLFEGRAAVNPFVRLYKNWLNGNMTLPISYETSLSFNDPDNLKDGLDLIVGNIIKPYL